MTDVHHTQLQPAAHYAVLPPPPRPPTHRSIEPARQSGLETRGDNLQFSQQRAVIELLSTTAEHLDELAKMQRQAEERRAELREQAEAEQEAKRAERESAEKADYDAARLEQRELVRAASEDVVQRSAERREVESDKTRVEQPRSREDGAKPKHVDVYA